ncbi:MAG TPA: tetratricopeptide repeat protein, partial [Vicinamibacteria bacterium]|nr:tetratricopeptide repeat protein [Vicinamibacteria bacterium]
SWSVLDDPNDTNVAPSASHRPAWPEPEEQEPILNRLGVPKWSSRDDPDETPTPSVGMSEGTSPEQEPAREDLAPPSWSILDDSRRAAPKEKKESPALAEPSEELVLHFEEEGSTTTRAPEFSTPFTDPMDAPPSTGELFIELEPEEDGGASMLSPIPVEEVHIEEEQELLIVVDQDAFADLPETLEELARRPSTSPETVRAETKARQDADVLIPPKQERVVTPGKVVRGAERIGDAVESRPGVSIPRGGEAPPAHRSPERSSTPSPRRAPKAERSSQSVPIRMDDGTPISAAGPHPHGISLRDSASPHPALGLRTPISDAGPHHPHGFSPRDSALPHPTLGPKAPEAEPSPGPVVSRRPRPAPHQESSGVAGTRHRAETPTQRSTEQGPEPDGDKEVDTAAHEERMRAQRMTQGGGEARILRDVKLHFKVRDWDGAVRLLHELIKIAPANSLYRGMLARAMSRHPTLRSDAEEHFHEALRLAPQDPEIHYWLGVYYLSFGLKSRAVTEFKTTLRIDPKHEPARKQLSASGQREDALGGVFKKLFG